MLAQACAESLISRRPFPLRKHLGGALFHFAPSIDTIDFKPGLVYKTHDYPPKQPLPTFVRIVYTYADPIDIVASLLAQHRKDGDTWIAEHAAHLKAGPVDLDDIYRRDVFHFERHFDQWMAARHLPLFAVRYDRIWAVQDKLATFLSVPLTLPPQRARRSSVTGIPEDRMGELMATYERLREKIDGCEMVVARDW